MSVTQPLEYGRPRLITEPKPFFLAHIPTDNPHFFRNLHPGHQTIKISVALNQVVQLKLHSTCSEVQRTTLMPIVVFMSTRGMDYQEVWTPNGLDYAFPSGIGNQGVPTPGIKNLVVIE